MQPILVGIDPVPVVTALTLVILVTTLFVQVTPDHKQYVDAATVVAQLPQLSTPPVASYIEHNPQKSSQAHLVGADVGMAEGVDVGNAVTGVEVGVDVGNAVTGVEVGVNVGNAVTGTEVGVEVGITVI